MITGRGNPRQNGPQWADAIRQSCLPGWLVLPGRLLPGSQDKGHRMMTLPVSALWKVVPLSILIANSLLAQEDIARDVWRDLQHVPRDSVTAGDHPGNVFLSGERVTIQVPERTACPFRWRAMDDDGTEVARGEVTKSEQRTIELGMLGIGWYRIEWFDSSGEELGWTTAAVLARLAVPTPQDSPICVNGARPGSLGTMHNVRTNSAGWPRWQG